MQRPHLTLAALVLLLSSSAGAQELFPPKKDPYRNLFAPRPPEQKIVPEARAEARPPQSKPTVVCGTVIVPADPTIDPKIHAKRPDDRVRYTLRSVAPPICKPE